MENLSPVECLSLISNMNRKRFLNRQVYVTSVVSASPVKPTVQMTRPESNSSSLEDNLPPNLGETLVRKPPPPSPKNLVPDPLPAETPTSPSVQEKISQIEQQTSSTSASISRLDKRKPEDSPETAKLSRKEKKILKGEERKQEKLKKKLEYKQKNSVNVQINHSY